ncbi:MAG TPA: glycosyltransferase [Alphaproteobacteria bacterium]|nr:glycosyltransferase [Alphaproteobacteria bacterium]
MTGRYALVIPTLDAGPGFALVLDAVRRQTRPPDRLVVVDSGSRDGTAAAARAAGAEVSVLPPGGFDHGGTRAAAVAALGDCEIVAFLTQDAEPASPDSLALLLGAFADPAVAAAYGRQLPRPGADPFERHARGFNYPAEGAVRRLEDRRRLGLRAAFCSNSFAAWRRDALLAAGNFPAPCPFGEDMVAAARLLRAGRAVAYRAEAAVWHSHAEGPAAIFARNRAIGRLHAAEPWLRSEFGGAEREGLRLLAGQLAFVARTAPLALWRLPLRAALRYAGYRWGLAGR